MVWWELFSSNRPVQIATVARPPREQNPTGNRKSFLMDAFGNLVDVWEPDPVLGIVGTGYSYDVLNHLIQVYMPRGSTSQVRTFNYNTGTHGTTVGGTLQSATNPENGTVSYTYWHLQRMRSHVSGS